MNTEVTQTFSVIDRGTNNQCNLSSYRIRTRGVVVFTGDNNVLEIGAGANFVNARFRFEGSGGKIKIGSKCKLNGDYIVKSGCTIEIGDSTKFNNPTARVHCGEANTSIFIGNNCLLANVRFRTSDQHGIIDLESKKRINPPADITVKDRVWLAEEVNVYKGVTIESGSIVGARSTVTKSLPGDALCVGTPAKAVKYGVAWVEDPTKC